MTKIKIRLISTITGKAVELELDFRPAPLLATGAVTARTPYPGGAVVWEIGWAPSERLVAFLAANKRKAPARFERGIACQNKEVGKYVSFPEQRLNVRIAPEPELAELWQWAWDLTAAEDKAREEYWAAERLAAQHTILATRPTGSVVVKRIGSAPDPCEAGMSVGIWQAGDGRTFAGGPDEQSDGIGYITEERLDKASASWAVEQQADAERKQRAREDRAKREAELLAAVVPPGALASYRRYSGDAEKAWAHEDEGAWADIGRYGAAIEAQGLAQ